MIEGNGIEWQKNSEDMDVIETRKSNLLLEAAILKAQGLVDAVDSRFAEVADLEEQLYQYCSAKGLFEKAQIHAFSAASSWAQAGDFHHALVLCNDLLQSDLPQRLRERVQSFSNTIRQRRTTFAADLRLAEASV